MLTALHQIDRAIQNFEPMLSRLKDQLIDSDGHPVLDALPMLDRAGADAKEVCSLLEALESALRQADVVGQLQHLSDAAKSLKQQADRVSQRRVCRNGRDSAYGPGGQSARADGSAPP